MWGLGNSGTVGDNIIDSVSGDCIKETGKKNKFISIFGHILEKYANSYNLCISVFATFNNKCKYKFEFECTL